MSDLIQVRRGTSAQWAAANPVLAEGEPGFDTTTGDFKVGNGATPWAMLNPPVNSRYVTIPTTWAPVTFTNAWVDFAGGVQACQYQSIGTQVYLRGAMKTGTIGLAAFTLPVGFRPPATLGFSLASNGAFGQLNIDSAGVVNPAIGSNVIFHINCNFSTVT